MGGILSELSWQGRTIGPTKERKEGKRVCVRAEKKNGRFVDALAGACLLACSS